MFKKRVKDKWDDVVDWFKVALGIRGTREDKRRDAALDLLLAESEKVAGRVIAELDKRFEPLYGHNDRANRAGS